MKPNKNRTRVFRRVGGDDGMIFLQSAPMPETAIHIEIPPIKSLALARSDDGTFTIELCMEGRIVREIGVHARDAVALVRRWTGDRK